MHRMLIVDDEESICFSMSEYFSMHGFDVHCAQNREEAEALLTENDYSIVIEDLRLGGIDGVEGLEIIEQARQMHPGTRIIVLTAYGSSEMEEVAKARGSDAFLRKPKPLSDVAQVVFGLLEISEDPAPRAVKPTSEEVESFLCSAQEREISDLPASEDTNPNQPDSRSRRLKRRRATVRSVVLPDAALPMSESCAQAERKWTQDATSNSTLIRRPIDMSNIKNFLRDEEGMELPEYAVAGALIVIGIVVAYTTLRTAISNALGRISGTLDNAS